MKLKFKWTLGILLLFLKGCGEIILGKTSYTFTSANLNNDREDYL